MNQLMKKQENVLKNIEMKEEERQHELYLKQEERKLKEDDIKAAY